MRSLAKYLWLEGWNPTVLCVQGPVAVWSANEVQDDQLLEGFPPEIEIVRTPYLDLRAWERLHPAHNRPFDTTSAQSRPIANAALRSSLLKRVARSCAAAIRTVLYFPDPTSGWIPHALMAAVRLHRARPFTAVFTSSPPRSALVVGLIFKFLFGVPWTAELMDPWYKPSGAIRRWAEQRLLRAILSHADRVVVMTEGHAVLLREEFGIDASHFEVIPNGYDEEHFRGLPQLSPQKAPRAVLTHVGTIYTGCAGRFFDAVSELIQEQPHLEPMFHIDVIGSPDELTTSFATSAQGRRIVTLHGYKPHPETLAAMAGADYLLLFLALKQNSQLVISSKIYEYLRIGRPIVAVTYDGEVKRLIERSGAGIVLPPDDINAIKAGLRHIIVDRPVPLAKWSDYTEQFRYDRLATRLAAVIDATVIPA